MPRRKSVWESRKPRNPRAAWLQGHLLGCSLCTPSAWSLSSTPCSGWIQQIEHPTTHKCFSPLLLLCTKKILKHTNGRIKFPLHNSLVSNKSDHERASTRERRKPQERPPSLSLSERFAPVSRGVPVCFDLPKGVWLRRCSSPCLLGYFAILWFPCPRDVVFLRVVVFAFNNPASLLKPAVPHN